MNYIIFNGIDSRQIKGLIISELPPITKAPKKNEVIEIDGLDGDIVVEKGYKSYVKTMQIGLKKNHNIDEIIHFFNQNGEITFSNEPDKKYFVQVLDQIDFARLARFRIATVNFYAKPYKYLVDEKEVSKSFTADAPKELIVTNLGYENSKPEIYMKGSGTVELIINGVSSFKYNFDTEEVIIDSEKQDAYFKSKYKNRNMIGKFPEFKNGKNKITWTGNITELKVKVKSRWL